MCSPMAFEPEKGGHALLTYARCVESMHLLKLAGAMACSSAEEPSRASDVVCQKSPNRAGRNG